ncbi:glycoside hydrolase [Podospora australis]|uniref:alpha-1,2-Mannosidase n=1 Tax=Podospora australis TaxID=1536484 RepID=A0AAN7AEM6_9PEZI|nr:glycoside hydrolase [Podospora australis]
MGKLIGHSSLRRQLLGSHRPMQWREFFIIVCTLALVLTYRLGWLDELVLSYQPPESVRLERYMNLGELTYEYEYKKSSINWGMAKLKYPPTKPLAKLPDPDELPPLESLPRIQHVFDKETPEEKQLRDKRRRAVRDLTVKSWEGYRAYAWKKDALLPLTGGFQNQFSGWAATLVDSLDTLWIMGLREEFDEAVAAVAEIDFGNSSTPYVNIFETNIRYLGGLLAAYDLSGREVLLQKAVELGNLIYLGFDTHNRLPVDNISLMAANNSIEGEAEGQSAEWQVVSASPGTLTLELTRLSQITGDNKYYDAVDKLIDVFARGQNKTLVPGLFPMYVSMQQGNVTTGNTFTIAGNADSLYEYLPKMHLLLSQTQERLGQLTRGFLDAAKRHLFFRPMVPGGDDILISGNLNVDEMKKKTLDPETEHLACFIGGTLALAGRMLESEEDVVVGARLTRGCVYAYQAFPTGIMPERLNMIPCESSSRCTWNETKWNEEKKKRYEYKPHLPKGFTTAKDPRYILRPEAIESVFYMWRITGEQEWADAAWDMFESVVRATKTPLGAATVKDVTVSSDKVEQEDFMESFWIAETLKYFYLIFSPPDLISLDRYILNTEAHPFLRPEAS